MRPAARFLMIGIAVGIGEAALGFVLLGTILALYFWLCGAATIAFALGAHRLLDAPPPPPGGGSDDRGPGHDPPPDPPWWPEFEAQFRAHVHERGREPAAG